MKSFLAKRTGAVILISILAVFGLASCSNTAESSSSIEGLTGGIAATVNGAEILEDDVTSYIQTLRANNNLLEEEAWGNHLASINDNPEQLRGEIIDMFVAQKLTVQACEERGIEVTDEELDEAVASMRNNYSSDEAWASALEQAGLTEEVYRENVKNSILDSKLQEAIGEEADPVSEDERLEMVQMYASIIDGAKRSSHILFSLDNKETAEKVLAQLQNGEISFEDAAKEYSVDGSATKGGDVGWDKISGFTGGFVTEYQEALDALELDQMSGLVESQYGYHIIKCTEIYTLPKEGVTSVDQVPEDLLTIIDSQLESNAKTMAVSNWYAKYKEEANIVVNDMPEGLPYDLDMSAYQTESSESDSSLEVTTEDSSDSETSAEDVVEDDTQTDAAASADEADADEQPAEISSEAEGRSSE